MFGFNSRVLLKIAQGMIQNVTWRLVIAVHAPGASYQADTVDQQEHYDARQTWVPWWGPS